MREVNPIEGLFIIAGGVLPYFTEQEVKSLTISIADKYSKCEFVFDVVSWRSRLFSNQLIKKAGFASAPMKWVVNRNNNLNTWDDRVAIFDHFPLFAHIERLIDFDKNIIRFMNKTDKHWGVSFIHLKFGG